MDITNKTRLDMIKEWLTRLAAALVARGKLTQPQANAFLTACQGLSKDFPLDLDFFIIGDRNVKALGGGILKLPNGDRLLLAPNPQRAWTQAEWQALVAAYQAEKANLESQKVQTEEAMHISPESALIMYQNQFQPQLDRFDEEIAAVVETIADAGAV